MNTIILKPLLCGFFCLHLIAGFAQHFKLGYYCVSFADKTSSAITIEEASNRFSSRCADRRSRLSVSADSLDLPVAQKYIASVVRQGAMSVAQSRWLNAGLFLIDDSLVLQAVSQLPKVVSVEWLGPTNTTATASRGLKFYAEDASTKSDYVSSAYGQLDFMNASFFSELGIAGKGVCVAVLDAGFRNADRADALSHIYSSEQLVADVDIAQQVTGERGIDFHGTAVFGLIGGIDESVQVSAAPSADFILLRTEIAEYEYKIEEFLWCLGAEYADSAGADVINSSLGYSEFDDARQDYSHNDLDGKTALVSKAAAIAWEKGIFVVTSAGNNGHDRWLYISSPADVPDVLAVGSLSRDSIRSYFSSYGTDLVSYIKPDVVMLGENPYTVNSMGIITRGGKGTSFSSPLVAGAVACLIEAFPNKSLHQIKTAVVQSSHLYRFMNTDVGAGVPNFRIAYNSLLYGSVETSNGLLLFPSPATEEFSVLWQGRLSRTAVVEIYSLAGRSMYRQQVEETGSIQELRFSVSAIGLAAGEYLLTLTADDERMQVKFSVVNGRH